MKGLDTSVLLSLLEGDPGIRGALKGLRGVELATTEANLLELSYIAAKGPPRTRAGRSAVLDRLRRKITVLPVDSHAIEAAEHHLVKDTGRLSPLVLAAWATLESRGCDELFVREVPEPVGRWRFKLTRIGQHKTKTRHTR